MNHVLEIVYYTTRLRKINGSFIFTHKLNRILKDFILHFQGRGEDHITNDSKQIPSDIYAKIINLASTSIVFCPDLKSFQPQTLLEIGLNLSYSNLLKHSLQVGLGLVLALFLISYCFLF